MMNTRYNFIGIVGLGILSALGNAYAAPPKSGVDFSQTEDSIDITTLSTLNPNVLRTVSVKCPRQGFTVAIANTKLQYTAGPAFIGTMAFSISRNSTAFDSATQQNIFGNYVNDLHTSSVSLQRVDSCKKNKTVTYRFLGTRGTNAGNASASQPRIAVMFFENKL